MSWNPDEGRKSRKERLEWEERKQMPDYLSKRA